MPKENEYRPEEQSPLCEGINDAVEISQAEYLLFLDRVIESPNSSEEQTVWAQYLKNKVIEQEGMVIQRFYFSISKGCHYVPRPKGQIGFRR